ncbi:MAG: hypothetical protein MMC33_003201 [Icmadophila ericetorum]|nr:hypothetical protein [Icmadophila ericetorum]
MSPSTPPRLLGFRSSTKFIVSTVAIGLFTDLFLYGLIVPILPFILEDRVHIPQSQIQAYSSALLAAYAGASVLASPPAGIIADKLPARQVPFLAGLLALLGATVLLYLGQSIALLIVARVLQGISAAVVWTIGLALLLDTVGSEKLGVTIGSIFGFISIGELTAPVLGGVVYERVGSGGVFAMGFALLGLDFVMRLLVIEKKTARKYKTDADVIAATEDNDDENTITGEGPREEATEEDPLLKIGNEDNKWKIPPGQPRWIRKLPILYCLGNPRLIVAELVAFMQATLLATFDATIPTEAQSLFGFDSLKAGLLFAPLVLPYLVLGPAAGKLVDKYGPKPAAVLGFAFEVLALILLRVPQPGGTVQIVVFCILVALNGVGLAAIGSPSIVEASYVCDGYFNANRDFFGGEGPYAQLYAINSMVFSAGLTLGPLLSGSLRDAIGYGNMNAVVAALCLITSVLSYVYLGGKPKLLRKHN